MGCVAENRIAAFERIVGVTDLDKQLRFEFHRDRLRAGPAQFFSNTMQNVIIRDRAPQRHSGVTA